MTASAVTLESDSPVAREHIGSPAPTAVMLLTVSGTVLLAAAVLLPWWHLTGAAEPWFISAVRLIAICPLAASVVAIVLPRFRASGLFTSTAMALALPLILVAGIEQLYPAGIAGAVDQTDQAARLISGLSNKDLYPALSWNHNFDIGASPLARNEYTIVDGCVAVAMFCKGGWYASLLAGLLLLPAAWLDNSRAQRLLVRRWRGLLAVCGLAPVAAVALRSGVSFAYWNAARSDMMRSDYAGALLMYHHARSWDERLNYDLVYHFELGRLYQKLGMWWKPDYWASRGDVYMRSGETTAAYDLYRHHIVDIDQNPTVRLRYANTLYKYGADWFAAYRTGMAVDVWQAALRLEPTNLEIRNALATAYTMNGNYREAVAQWKQIIHLNNSVGLFWMKYFAADEYRKVITARAWQKMGWCYYKLGDVQRAMSCRYRSGLEGPSSAADVASP
ncbi:MAG: hypothetical protein KGJ62_12145 [Armatimonadetes bacterium]|nr:hypothetical protein [Armatimonadota bacterium]MDE2206890.1 hypothetical protein [Armatimonadota bacterium]